MLNLLVIHTLGHSHSIRLFLVKSVTLIGGEEMIAAVNEEGTLVPRVTVRALYIRGQEKLTSQFCLRQVFSASVLLIWG